jgi:hypothetical protein
MPNEEQTYRDSIRNDIKNLGNLLELRLSTSDRDTRDSLSRIETEQGEIKTQVQYTNGKVRKTIIALVLMFGLLIGLGFDKAGLVLSFLGI